MQFLNGFYCIYDENNICIDYLNNMYANGVDTHTIQSITDYKVIIPKNASYMILGFLTNKTHKIYKKLLKNKFSDSIQNIETEIINARTINNIEYASLQDCLNNNAFLPSYKNQLLKENYIDIEFEYDNISAVLVSNNGKVAIVSNSNNYKVTKPIPVNPYEYYHIIGYTNYANTAFIIRDADNNVIYTHEFLSTGVTIHKWDVYYQIPSNGAYLLVATVNPYDVTIQKNSGFINILNDDVTELASKINNINKMNNKKLRLIKNGDTIQICSAFSDTIDMLINCGLHSSSGHAFNFISYSTIEHQETISGILNGTLYKQASDDIAPNHFNSSYRGGNHGAQDGYTLTFNSAHGLTESDIGKYMVDANNRNVLIIKIKDETSILVVQPKDNIYINGQACYDTPPASPLTYNGESYTFTPPSTFTQITPGINNVSVKLIADGIEITENGVYDVNTVEVLESYNIYYVPAMINYLIEHAGNNTNNSYYSDDIDSACLVTCNYKFGDRGTCIIYQNNYFTKEVKIENICMVQSMTIGNYFFVPGSNNYLISAPSNSTNIYKSGDIYGSRYYQYSDETLSKGFCIGYCPEYFDGKSENRDGMGYFSGAKKLYPRIRDVTKEYPAGTNFSAIAFRVPLNTYDTDIPCVGWYYMNNDIYLMIDVQKSVNKSIRLPKEFVGKKITIVESFGDITIPYNLVASQDLKIIVNNYGSVVLKLY